ncbi:hypothetical protein CRI94_12210 [Longibacter salinarum]|uniref:Bacterial Pleckstrin homology domain-containing protein n=1 Tax=Longibacter salinarum TaxID=1850348 RepID=A0A2A8CVV4_9BACT|nr:hypothetical protein [Longibacter salinarum]PEN12776.1 hypothetical protein CRI94_12210 [Longibacter salinarum]
MTGDRLRGEALFILTLTTLVMGVLIAHYLGWALLQPMMTGSDTSTWQIGFWLAQVGSVAFLLLIGGIGWRPEVIATIDTEAGLLSVEQGNVSASVDVDDIQDVSVVSARQYHLHYRRYAATKPFIGKLGDEVVIVRTTQGPLAISIDDAEAGALVDLVSERDELLVESAPAS